MTDTASKMVEEILETLDKRRIPPNAVTYRELMEAVKLAGEGGLPVSQKEMRGSVRAKIASGEWACQRAGREVYYWQVEDNKE